MAVDKLVDSAQLDSDLGDIADAILAKSGGTGPIAFPAGFLSEIADISTGGGGGTVVRTGTFTPTTKELTASFDVGTTDTIKNVLVVPTSENPIKSDGRILYSFIVNADLYAKSIIIPTNSGGSGLQTPNASTSSTRMTQSGSTITLTSTSSYGQFQLISYTWFAW